VDEIPGGVVVPVGPTHMLEDDRPFSVQDISSGYSQGVEFWWHITFPYQSVAEPLLFE